VSDHIAETPNLARTYCPDCEPEADPSVEILETRYCSTHGTTIGGSEDEHVNSSTYMSGSSEAGGLDNKIWCDLVHRGIIGKIEG
jgi:hypothetical protein